MAKRGDNELEPGHVNAPAGDPKLHPELQEVLDRVGQANYGLATARMFRPGGKFNPRPRRQRYAIT